MITTEPKANSVTDALPQSSRLSNWENIFDPSFVAQLANDIYMHDKPASELAEQPSIGLKENKALSESIATSGNAPISAEPNRYPPTAAKNSMDAENISPVTPFETKKTSLPEKTTNIKYTAPAIAESPINLDYYFLPLSKTESIAKSEQPFPNDSIETQVIRKDFPILQQKINGKPLIWFDNAATTQKPQAVIDTLSQYYREYNSNIHRAAHTLAKLSTTAYEAARGKIQHFIGASSPEEIIFLRGTTEAINLVAQSYGRKNIHPGDELLISNMEHHSNIVPWQMLQQETGAVIKVIPINDRGEVILEQYEKLFTPRTRMVALTHVSNVLGTINPLRTMIEVAHYHKACVLIDGAQSTPHFKVDVRELDADFFAFSGHKVYGPTGIGVLFGKKALLEEMPPWQGGGSMIKQVTFNQTHYNNLPYKFEAGTGNIADAVGLGTAVDYIQKIGLPAIERHERRLTNYAMESFASLPGLCLIGTSPNKISVVSFIVRGATPEELAHYLDQEGIAVRTGHHCAQPALERFGLTNVLRVSLGLYNTQQEIDTMVGVLAKIIRNYR